MLRWLWRLIVVAVVFGVLLSPIWGLLLLIEQQPRVTASIVPSIESVGRAERLLRDVDPRRLRQGQLKTVALKERDVNVALGHLSTQFGAFQHLRTQVDFTPDAASVEGTLSLPSNPVGQFINFAFMIVSEASGVSLSRMRLGRIAVPEWVLSKAFALLNNAAQNRVEYRDLLAALKAVDKLSLTDRSASVSFRWDSELAARLGEHGRDLLLPGPERDRLLAYRRHINGSLAAHGERTVALSKMLKSTFTFAATRATDSATLADEYRAALLALALTAVDREQAWRHLLGDAYVVTETPARRARLTLHGRDDLPKHFLVSAALAGAADTVVADVIGVYKEVKDSQGGSGFSFVDLAADHAGIRFAEKAARAPRDLQAALAKLSRQNDLVPSHDLVEGLQEAEFKRRYRDRDSAEYRKIIATIDRRLAGLALYR